MSTGGVWSAPQQERSRRTHVAILAAGTELLEEGGPDALVVSAVAERAGVSVGGVYRRFGTKDQLLLALPGIRTDVGPVVRIVGWFAGGLWCAVIARWLWMQYGRDLRELPGLIWGGVLLVVLELVARRHDAT